MLLSAALLTIAAAQPTESGYGLPASFRRDVLHGCAPASLEAAHACLRQAVSPEDLAILSNRVESRRFRGYLDCEIETAWRLGDPKSPMATEMAGLLGLHAPGLAVGMIISDFQARSMGRSLPFEVLREGFKTAPPDGDIQTTCTADTVPPANEKNDAN